MTEPTAEELKNQKRERIRRNLRILALCVAAYYFISAGFSWYEEKQKEQNSLVPDRGPLTAQSFSASLNAACALFKDSPLCQSTQPLDIVPLSLGDGSSISLAASGDEFQNITVQFEYQSSLSQTQINCLLPVLAALENNKDPEAAKKLATALGFEAGKADTVFEDKMLHSPDIQYSIVYRPGEPKLVTLSAAKYVEMQ